MEQSIVSKKGVFECNLMLTVSILVGGLNVCKNSLQ